MRRIRLLTVGLLAASCVSVERPSPLGDLSGVTRIEVSTGGQRTHAFQFPTDSLRIAWVVEAVHTRQSGWERTWHTLPSGDIAILFIRDSAVVGVVQVGSEFLVARGADETLIANISRVDELHLRALLNPVTVLGTISNQIPKPPQN